MILWCKVIPGKNKVIPDKCVNSGLLIDDDKAKFD